MSFEVDGKTLYRVEVEQTMVAYFHVLADSDEDAQADARVLTENLDDDEWQYAKPDLHVFPANFEPADNDWYWTGGDDGDTEFWQRAK